MAQADTARGKYDVKSARFLSNLMVFGVRAVAIDCEPNHAI